MPIVIPTLDEIERMDSRQRDAILARLEGDRERAADSIAFLTRQPRPFTRLVTRAELLAARRRYARRTIDGDAETIRSDARFLLDRMPIDPDIAQHRVDLLEAVK